MTSNIPALDRKIVTLVNKVSDMKNSETSLLAQLHALRSSLQNHELHLTQLRNTRAPIAALPNEILAEVFKAGPSRPWDRLHYVMSVAQICHHWRAVAISVQSLWANAIHIGAFSVGNWLQLMDLFLERSGECPLDIVICRLTYRYESNASDQHLERLHARLLGVVHRWRKLVVVGKIFEDVLAVMSPFRELFAPLLETLEIIVRVSEYAFQDFVLRIFRGGTPRLSHLKIDGIHFSSCKPLTSSVVSFHFGPRGHCQIREYEAALAEMSNLTDLHLHGKISLDLARLKSSSLRSLTISIDPVPLFDALSYFLRHMEAPNLQSLAVHRTCLVFRERDVDFAFPVCRLPQLRSLSLHCGATLFREAAGLFKMFPIVTHLTLKFDGYESSAYLIHHLLPESYELRQQNHFIPLPELRVISLSLIGLRGLNVLCDVIESRISCGAPLACVQLSYLEKIPVATLEWLKKHVAIERFDVWELECCEEANEQLYLRC